MSHFHPDLDLLTEFSAGSLPLAQSACISMHVNQCPHCVRAVTELNELGANLFELQEREKVGDAQLNAVLARLDEDQPLAYPKRTTSAHASATPAILQRLMRGDFSDLKWTNIGNSLRISYLRTGDPNYEFALYHMRAGGRVPEHTHRGMEFTLVLQGGFSDVNGSYGPGDFLLRRPGEVHSPTALQSEDCICVGVLDAPLKFTDWKFRWLNPFLKLRAA